MFVRVDVSECFVKSYSCKVVLILRKGNLILTDYKFIHASRCVYCIPKHESFSTHR